ncbi:hypothetical protein ACIBF5_26550 [Micromonospora sp. NPDC050417]|uniref:hypothetical protein n=1 Tax=Micromonospora sp. NPDC050417 TaxID=3364280 RepID=UPI0037969175
MGRSRCRLALRFGEVAWTTPADRTTDYVFDRRRMLSFDGNTVPYLPYALRPDPVHLP